MFPRPGPAPCGCQGHYPPNSPRTWSLLGLSPSPWLWLPVPTACTHRAPGLVWRVSLLFFVLFKTWWQTYHEYTLLLILI